MTTGRLASLGKGEEGSRYHGKGTAGTTTGVGEGNWYLVRSDKEVADEVQQITNLLSASQAISFASELDASALALERSDMGLRTAFGQSGHMSCRRLQGPWIEQKTEDLHIGLGSTVLVNEGRSLARG